MQRKDRAGAERSEEARRLAEEAVEEAQHGNKEEARFVLDEARKLDPKAAHEVARGGQTGAAT